MALQRWHERLVVDVGVDDIDRGEDACQDGAESEDPRVAPARIDDQPRRGEEEGVPQAGLTHRAKGRALQRHPQPEDEGEVNE